MEKCVGNDEAAIEKFEALRIECGRRELEFERWYDHSTWFAHNSKWIKASTKRGEEFRDFDE
jgi:hypothetical protein